MREAQFIKKNIERWESYKQTATEPDVLAQRLTYLIDDLGYAKTNYGNSQLVTYINSLAAEIYLEIYKNKKEKGNRVVHFFKTEVPCILYRNRKILWFSVILFLLIVLVGVLTSYLDPNFIRSILGDHYVNETMHNIKQGKPFDIYNDPNSYQMFLFIALNNIRISLMCMTWGVFAGLGTFYIMFTNGIMVGAFYQMFAKEGLGVDWFFSVMLHGTLELFSITIACMSGFLLGKSMLFRGTYSFLNSIRRGAMDALKILLTTVPLLFVAAVIESYLTRYYAMPVFLSSIILGMSLIFIIWYFFIYPQKIAKKVKQETVIENWKLNQE